MSKIKMYNAEEYTPEENAILCMLSFSREDKEEEFKLLKKAATDLLDHYQQQDDYHSAEIYKKRLNDLDEYSVDVKFSAPNIKSKASGFSDQTYFELSDWLASSRVIVGGIHDVLTTYHSKSSFLPKNFGLFGMVHTSVDLMFNAGACLNKVFYPTTQDVNLTYSDRLFKQINKGDRPYRFAGSAINIASSAINLTTSIPIVGLVTTILSSVLGTVLTGMQIMKDLDTYDSLLKKLEDSKKANPSSPHWDKIKKKVVAKKNEALVSHNVTLAINQCFLISVLAMVIVAPQIILPVMLALTLLSVIRKFINKELEKQPNPKIGLFSHPRIDEHRGNDIIIEKKSTPTVR